MCTPGWSTYSTANESLAGLPSGKLWSLPWLLLPTGHPTPLLSLGPLALTGGLPGRPLWNVASTPPLCKGCCSRRLPARLVPSDFPRPRPALCGSERHLSAGKWFSPSPAPGLGPAGASPLTWGWRCTGPGQLAPNLLPQVPPNHDHQKRVTAQVGTPSTP